MLSGRAVGVAQPVHAISVAQPVPVRPFRYVLRVLALLGYARVSTAAQNADLQIDELTSAGCYEVFVDRASEVLDRCPELDNVLERPRPGDTLVVWRLGRRGRSLRHLIDTVTALDERGVGFRRCGSRSTRRPPGGGWCFTCSVRWPSSSGRSFGTGRWRGWRRPGPGVATAAGPRS